MFLNQMLNLNCLIESIYTKQLARKVTLIQVQVIRIKQRHKIQTHSHKHSWWYMLTFNKKTYLGIFFLHTQYQFELNTIKNVWINNLGARQMVSIVLSAKWFCYRLNIFSFSQLLSLSVPLFFIIFSFSLHLCPAKYSNLKWMNDLYLIKCINSYLVFIKTNTNIDPHSTYMHQPHSQRTNIAKYIFRVFKNNGIVRNLHAKK